MQAAQVQDTRYYCYACIGMVDSVNADSAGSGVELVMVSGSIGCRVLAGHIAHNNMIFLTRKELFLAISKHLQFFSGQVGIKFE